jgi:methionine aminotransferase
VAQYLVEKPESWQKLSQFFQAKRDRVIAALDGTGFVTPPAQGTYFQLVEYTAFSNAPDVQFAERLLVEAGVATIPLSPFYQDPPRLTMVRVCLAKKDQTLDDAIARLQSFAHGLLPEDDDDG